MRTAKRVAGFGLLLAVLAVAENARRNAEAQRAPPGVLATATLMTMPGGDVPIFDGMPTNLPATAIPVWARSPDGKGWGPRPERFAQWLPMMSPEMSASEYGAQWQSKYMLGVIEPGGSLEFYVLGSRNVNSGQCCSVVVNNFTATQGSGTAIHTQRRGSSGRAPHPWVCESRPAECFSIIPRPAITWPLAPSEPPPRAPAGQRR